MISLLFFTACYAIVAIYKLTYVSRHYESLRYSATGIGLHLLMVVIRNGATAAGLNAMTPAQWNYVHYTTISLTVLGVLYQVRKYR